MSIIIKKLKEKISFSEKSFFYSSIIKAIGVIVSLLLSQYVAKLFNVELFGYFNLFESYLQILVVLSLFGARQMIVKKVSILYEKNSFKEIQIWFNSSILAVSITTFFVLLIYNIAVNYLLSDSNLIKRAFQIGGFIIYIKVLLFILSSFYSSHNKLWQSNLVDRAVLPFIFLILLFIGNKYTTLNFSDLFSTYLISASIFLVLVFVYWLKFYNKTNSGSIELSLKKVFNVQAIMFLILSFLGLFFLKIDIIILGFFGSSYDLGIYSTGAKVAFLLNFFTPVIHSVYTPKISILYNKNNLKKIKKILYNSVKVLLSFGFLIFIVLFLLGKDILNFWGLEYIKAYNVLLILSFANIISMSLSMCLPIIMMCNQEKRYLKKLIFLIIIGSIFLAYGSSNLKLESFALIMSFFIIVESIMKFYIVKKNLFHNT